MDYITLTEIYIYNPKLFKTKNLNSFVKSNKIQEVEITKLKSNKLGIKTSWVKKNLPSFSLKLKSAADIETSDEFFEVQSTLEKYKCKNFNPLNFNLDSSMVQYFDKDGQRVPYFNKKGLIKINMHFNDFEEDVFNWIHNLYSGQLRSHLHNLHNIIEMCNLDHVPIAKHVNGSVELCTRVYSVDDDDVMVDFKRIGDLKKEKNLKEVVAKYKCPLYSLLELNFKRKVENLEKDFESKIKELKQEKQIAHLQQELDKEKSLRDQAVSLTQSFIPPANSSEFIDKERKHSDILKPSKIY